MIAIPNRTGAQRSQIGARTRFGITLCPPLARRNDRRQETLLLLLVAEGGDHRADIFHAERNQPRTARTPKLVLQYKPLQRGPTQPTVLSRPMRHSPPATLE